MWWIVLVTLLLCVVVVGALLWQLFKPLPKVKRTQTSAYPKEQKTRPAPLGMQRMPNVPTPKPRPAGSQIKPPPSPKKNVYRNSSTVIAKIDPVTGEKVVYMKDGDGYTVRRETLQQYTTIDWGDGRGPIIQSNGTVPFEDELTEMGGQDE